MTTRLAALVGIRAEEDATPIPEGITPPSRSKVLDTKRALSLDSVFRAVQVLQTAASQLTLDAWRDTRQLTGASYPAALTHPWEDADQTDLITETVASLALRGNAYLRVIRDENGSVISIRPLDPLECAPTIRTGSGARTVEWRGKTYGPRDIAHLRLLRLTGSAEGLGPIQACQQAILGALDMSTYATNFVAAGGIPTGILTTDQPISPKQAKEAAAAWMENNSRANGIAVLGQGLNFTPLLLKPEEVQFLESREFDSKAVARMFGIPAHLMHVGVEGSSLTYQNVQDADISLIRWTLMAYLRPIESAISRVLPGRTSVRFNLDAFLRPDTRTRYDTYAAALQAGFLTIDEVRDIEGITKETE